MESITIAPLQEGLTFGARITGVTSDALDQDEVRRQINDVFERCGMIVFEDIEQTGAMQVKLSKVFGPLKDHPVKMVERNAEDLEPGVITIRTAADAGIVEIDGKRLMTWQPWHFDHSYNNELNRAGVLRAETIAPDGGMTAFCDGIQVFQDLPEAVRDQLDRLNIIYTLDLLYQHQKFGLPANFRIIRSQDRAILNFAKGFPRAIHPAVWTRETGQKVVHMSPYGARGIEGMETPEGDALFQSVWDTIERTIVPYYHQWKPTDMLVWDNWRMLHLACGCDPEHNRIMHRTTIKGDYGLGRWELATRAPSAKTASQQL